MSRVCQVTGRRTRTGNRIARRGLPKSKGGIGLKTTGIRRRVYKPNLQWRRIWVEEYGQFFRVRVSTRALKTIDKHGAYKVLVGAGVLKALKPKARKKAAATS